MNLDQHRRYARQILLPDIGEAGQQRLLDARVLVIGAGGLGSALISYLAAAGIGTIGIIDDDRVELSNLARQILHETGDIGRLKVESAADRVAEINPQAHVISYPFALTAENAAEVISGNTPRGAGGYTLIADGCDNFTTRFVVNETCVRLGVPLVSAAAAGWQGHVMTIHPRTTPTTGCYRCFVHPEAPEANTCRETGIVGPLAGVMGSIQALEVVNTLLGKPALMGKLLRFDGKTMESRIGTLAHDTACPVCNGLRG